MKILGATLGGCIHVAGILKFLHLAGTLGYKTEFLGPAVSVERLVSSLEAKRPDIAAISYRLSPSVARSLFNDLKEEINKRGLTDIRLVFGGTPPVAEVAKAIDLFDAVFTGGESEEAVRDYLKEGEGSSSTCEYPQDLIARLIKQHPIPLIRHHLGLESVEQTVQDARDVALSGEVDVVSIAPDQNAQEYFFRPHEMPSAGHGAGGVPVRTPEDLQAIYDATRCGNFPLVRCYSGTRDLLRWAEMSVDVLNNAWAAIPIFWYSELDKRSDRPLLDAIRENKQVIQWYAERNIPVEINDSHQWSLRDSHDSVAVAVAYLSAYNAKCLGVRHFISQYMLNTPPGISPSADLAKMLAKIEMIESLHDDTFQTYRQIRTGLRSMGIDTNLAKGHLAASITLGMALKPHIVHVVSYCEAEHAARAQEIIESCGIARGAIQLCLNGAPNVSEDSSVMSRKERLKQDARLILDAICELGRRSKDPLTDPYVLNKAVRIGILDAPHLSASGVCPGAVVTMCIEGGYDPVDPKLGEPISEEERLRLVMEKRVVDK